MELRAPLFGAGPRGLRDDLSDDEAFVADFTSGGFGLHPEPFRLPDLDDDDFALHSEGFGAPGIGVGDGGAGGGSDAALATADVIRAPPASSGVSAGSGSIAAASIGGGSTIGVGGKRGRATKGAASDAKRARPDAAEEQEAVAAVVSPAGRGGRRPSRATSRARVSVDDDDDYAEEAAVPATKRTRGSGRAAAGATVDPPVEVDVASAIAASALMENARRMAAARVASMGEGGDGDDDDGEDEDEDYDDHSTVERRRGGGGGAADRNARSRERNRVHARKSRLRKKFFVDSLKANLATLEQENRLLRAFVEAKMGAPAEVVLRENGYSSSKAYAVPASATAILAATPAAAAAGAVGAASAATAAAGGAGAIAHGAGKTGASLLAGAGTEPTAVLEHGDYALVEALTRAQQNFVVSDPNLPDNPIVFASEGFYTLTGYTPADVIGRNCRFLQGPGTDPAAVEAIRRAVAIGKDMSICLLNYKRDGTPFYNSFFVAPLRGVDGRVVNFVGVQCEVKESVATALMQMQCTSIPAFLAATVPATRSAASSAAGGGSVGGSTGGGRGR